MNPLSPELPFHVHNWLTISLKDVCIVIRKWPNFWPSTYLLVVVRSVCITASLLKEHLCIVRLVTLVRIGVATYTIRKSKLLSSDLNCLWSSGASMLFHCMMDLGTKEYL